MSERARHRIRCSFLFIALLAGVGVSAVGVWSAPEYVMRGRDIVAGGTSGARPLVSGEDVLGEFMPDRYVWPVSPVTLKAVGGAVADTGYAVAWGLDSAYAEIVDSVQLTGLTVKTFSQRWRYVQAAEYHDDSTNTALVRLFHGPTPNIPDSLLCTIEARAMASAQAVFMQPANRTKLVPMSARVTYAYPTTADSRGRVSILERQPGSAWKEKSGANFYGGMPVVIAYDPRKVWETPPGTQYRVALGTSPSPTRLDVDVLFEFGVQ